MAKITAQEKERKKAILDAHIYEVFINEGWDALSYERIAKDFGTRKSSIQRYYEKRLDFGIALQGKIFPIIVDLLDFTDEARFIASWVKALENQTFREVNKLLIENATGSGTGGRIGVSKLLNKMKATMSNDEANAALKTCLGESVLFFLNQSLAEN